MRFTQRLAPRALHWLALIALTGCAAGSDGDACTRNSECDDVCVNGLCMSGVDAGRADVGGSDSGPSVDGGVRDVRVVEDVGAGWDSGPSDTGVSVPDTSVPDVPAVSPCGAPGCIGSVLRDGASAWTPIAADPTTAFAPPAPVVAAFDIETLDIGYVLTNTTFHLLRLSDGVYVASGSLSARFPGVSGTIHSATSIPAGHAGSDPNIESFSIVTRDLVFGFHYDISGSRVTSSGDPVDYSDDWLSALAPDRNVVLGAWLALENADGWVPGSPRDSCGRDADAFAVYVAYLADGFVHLFDAGHCADFVGRVPASSFTPFQRPGAPDFAAIGASFYHQGDLWVFNATPR